MVKKLIFFLLLIQVVFGDILRFAVVDNGRSLDAKVGDRVFVNLLGETGDGVVWTWSIPKPSDSKVLHKVSGQEADKGGAAADFKVKKLGTSEITAEKRCVVTKPGVVCSLAIEEWKVTVNVKKSKNP